MRLNILIYTTSLTGWFRKDFALIEETIRKATGVTEVSFTVKRTRLTDVRLKKDSDGDIKFDWGWFKEQYTNKSAGYNVVALHISRKEREAHGITVKGTYNNDTDNTLEFWLSADRGQKAKHYKHSEFSRVFVHELCGHGFARSTGANNDLVHEWDYVKKDIFNFPTLITFSSMQWRPYLDEPYFSNITQGFAVANPLYKKSGHHLGIDHGVQRKTDIPVYMPCDGTITRMYANDPVLGNCAVILSKDEQWAFRFAHLRDVPVIGTYRAGDKIGIVGNTGLSTAVHLHVDAWKGGIIQTSKIVSRDAILKYCVNPYELVKSNL